MPELPDVVLYVEHLQQRTEGRVLSSIRLAGPFVLQTVSPKPEEAAGKTVTSVSRIGKRIVFSLGPELHVAIHLMIAGRLQWKDPGFAPPKRVGLAAFDFDHGTLVLVEHSKRKRAMLHVLDQAGLAQLDRGGIEPLEATWEDFQKTLARENHTLKRTLTDPRLFSGIGNAYSDEILHRAKLSPLTWSSRISREEAKRLYNAVQLVLGEWVDRLRDQAGDRFPVKVTAFRPEMAVHGKYKEPCPVCGSPVQRIKYAENETNYCPHCQTGGRLLADRAMSKLLKQDWPRSWEEMEAKLAAERDANAD